MKRVNIYSENNIIGQAGLADSYFLRLRGLIGRNASELGGLLIKPCNQIHTWFMKEEIDVVYISKTGQVLKIDEGAEKFRFFAPVKGARMVLELPAETASALGISDNSVLKFSSDQFY